MRAIRCVAVSFLLIIITATCVAAQESTSLDEAKRLNDFGVEAAKKGLWDEARFRWQQAIEIYPNYPAAHNNLAVVSEHFGDYEAAKKHYQYALDLTDNSRYLESNVRMFSQFYTRFIRTLDEQDGEEIPEPAAQAESTEDSVENVQINSPNPDEDKLQRRALLKGPVYTKVGAARQILIHHPKRKTAFGSKYRRIFIAGFAPLSEESENLNFETTEYLRSELRKNSMYEVIQLEELDLPADLDEFDLLVDDYEFWSNIGNKVGADLIIYGTISFKDEPSDGFYPYEYQASNGQYRTVQMHVERTAFIIEIDLYFHDAATGELIHNESIGQTIIYRGRLSATLQAFYDVMNRVLPRFMDLMVPRERKAIRFVVNG